MSILCTSSSAHPYHQFYRDQHGRAKKKHEVDLAAYNAQHPDHVPTEAKDSGKKKKKDDEESDHPATKEVAKAAPKTAKKAAAPVRSFIYQL